MTKNASDVTASSNLKRSLLHIIRLYILGSHRCLFVLLFSIIVLTDKSLPFGGCFVQRKQKDLLKEAALVSELHRSH